MENNDVQLKKRFDELSLRAYTRGYAVYSDFLTLADQDVLTRCHPEAVTFGGYPMAERKIARFGEDYGEEPPVVCVEICPTAPKFADALTHRDFLGSLIGLGIERDVLGDIIVHENRGYLFCLESISDFIISELTQVKHTKVACKRVDAPPDASVKIPDVSGFVVSSERLDAIIAAVFRLSRSEGQELIDRELVFVNSRLYTSHTKELKCGDVVSARGHGRFIYEGIERETKKGRLRVLARVFS